MSENTYKPRHFRIIRHVTKNRILDIQDCLDIDKLRIEIVEFAEGQGAKLSVEHFAEPDALALVCHDILAGRPLDKYIEFKGTAQGEAVTSRVLVVERVQARNPIKITVSRGPGKVVGPGGIQPLGKPEASLSMLLSEFDARRFAFTILRHLAAFEAATYHARVAAGTRRVEAEPEQAPVPAPSAAAAPAAQARPAGPRGRAVESYWMAAERLGVSKDEAERILQGADGDWGRAWSTLRGLEQRAAERS